MGHSAAKRSLHHLGWTETHPRSSEVLAGGIGGFIQGIVLNPVLLLKTRVITDPAYRASGGVWETAKMSTDVGFQVIQREGVMALTKGGVMFTTKRFFDWTTRFLFVDMFENLLKGGDQSVRQTALHAQVLFFRLFVSYRSATELKVFLGAKVVCIFLAP